MFIVSLGKSFEFETEPNEVDAEEVQISFEKIKDMIGGFGTYKLFKSGITKILEWVKDGRYRKERFQKSRVQLFNRRRLNKTIS